MKMCIRKMFPSIAYVSIGRAWKGFFKGTGKSLHFSLFTESAVVNARPTLSFFLSTYLVRGFTLLHTKEESVSQSAP